MNTWHQFWSSYFGFNRQQRNGLFVLILLILILFVVRLSISHFVHPEPILVADFSEVKLPENSTPANDGEFAKNESITSSNGLFVFDPNMVSKEQLLKLGFREKTANTFLNYRHKGARFTKKEDLKKVYGISEIFYRKLEPFILLHEDTKPVKRETRETSTTPGKTLKKTELNSADSLALLSLDGIGPSFTKRILKYRNMLGGFVSVDQLTEVYGLGADLFLSIKDKVTVDPSLISKLKINTENFKELNKHPYVGYEDAKAIFNYRKKNGLIKTAEQLKEIFTDEAQYAKLLPYAAFE
jgi:competence protein ComEA